MKRILYRNLTNRKITQQIVISTIKSVFTFATLVIVAWSCYYDSEEFLYPTLNSSCDTTNVTFSSSVKPVLQQYCYSCHSNSKAASFGANIKLEDYADVKISADNGRLYGTIAHLPQYSPMPKGGGKIDDCDILIIKTWIDAGAPDN